MKKIKKWIYILATIIVITIIVIILFKIYSNKNSSDNKETDFENQIDYQANQNIEEETNRNKYYATKNIANKFISAIVQEDSETLNSVLEPTYKQKYNVTKNNVLNKMKFTEINNLTEYEMDNLEVELEIDKMYVKEKSVNISTYLVTGNLKSNILDINTEYSMIILEDSTNTTFYVLPNDFVNDNNYNDTNKFKDYINKYENIDANEYNKFEYNNIDDVTIINDYLSKYKDYLTTDIEKAYDLLSDDYKKEKFEDYSKYEKYINNHKRQLLTISFTKYKVTDKDDGKEYVCLDSNNNYYIFKETSIMNYKLYLDDYTVDIEEFLDKYNKANETTKIGMNTDKIIKAINRKDYDYIYKKLDQDFANNNFGSLKGFESYMNQNFNAIYETTYYNSSKENNVYVQPITLKVKDSDEQKSLNIIMKLEEGTDFVMSFSIK